MADLSDFERRLSAALELEAGRRRPVDAQAIMRAAAARPVRRTIVPRLAHDHPARRVPWRLIGVYALLVISVAAVIFIAGAVNHNPSGLIAFERDGDIYVGDLSTGAATAIVTGPEKDVSPYFSPDGRLLAYARARDAGALDEPPISLPFYVNTIDWDIVVVQPDGTGQRVITPSTFGRSDGLFGWTPDSRAIVADGRNNPPPAWQGGLGVSLLRVDVEAAPRLLVPPYGTLNPLFEPVNGIAGEFRPPFGDRVLTWDTNQVGVMDMATGKITQVGRDALRDFEPYFPTRLRWSPDGSQIYFTLMSDQMDGAPAWVPNEIGSFVMNADGTGLREVPGGGYWSPTDNRLAFAIPGSTRSIAIFDPDRGVERFVNATGEISGWSWSPDGDYMLITKTDGHLEIVGVDSGAVTSLPWVVGTPPSWQRVVR